LSIAFFPARAFSAGSERVCARAILSSCAISDARRMWPDDAFEARRFGGANMRRGDTAARFYCARASRSCCGA